MNTVDTLTKLWATSTKEQKLALLKEHGFNESWAEAKTMQEMVQRGGGIIAKGLHETMKEWKRRNPDTEVIFNGTN